MAGRDDEETRLTLEETEAIARLLAEDLPEDEPGAGGPSGGSLSGPMLGVGSDTIVLRYDLVGGSQRRPDDLPGLQLIHERFARELGGEFRRTVGQEGNFFAERIRHTRFAEVYANLEVPTALIMASFTGLGCSAIVNMHPELMMHFLDVLMGGRGGKVSLPGDLAVRGFTPTEQGLITHLVGIFSRALGSAWADVTRASLEVTRVATDPRHAALWAPGEAMVEQRLSVEWSEARGNISLYVPLASLRQYDAQLSRSSPQDKTRADPRDLHSVRQSLGPVPVEVKALLGDADLTVARLLNLKVGDIVRLDQDPEEPVTILVEGRPKLRGFPTIHRGNVAVRVEDYITPDTAEE